MSWFILFVVANKQVVLTQEFFGEAACNRALHELSERKAKAGSFCTPKSLGFYGEKKKNAD